jgi:hypothetical protein
MPLKIPHATSHLKKKIIAHMDITRNDVANKLAK